MKKNYEKKRKQKNLKDSEKFIFRINLFQNKFQNY